MQGLWREWRDERAVRYVLSGDEACFAALIHRYQKAAWAVACAITRNGADADDVVQDAFIRSYRHLDTLEAPNRFGAWFMTIVRHTALNLCRRRRDQVSLESLGENVQTDAEDHSRRELHALLHSALSDLEAGERSILALRYFAGHSIREIARLLDISPAAAAKRLERARGRVGDKLLGRLGAAAQDFSPPARKARAILGVVLEQGAAWYPVAPAAKSISVMVTLTALMLVFPAFVIVSLLFRVESDARMPPPEPMKSAEFTHLALAAHDRDLHPMDERIRAHRDESFHNAQSVATVSVISVDGAPVPAGKLRATAERLSQDKASTTKETISIWPTETAGVFLVPVPPDAQALRLVAADGEQYSEAMILEALEQDRALTLQLDQAFSASLSGRVELPAHAPLPAGLLLQAEWRDGPGAFNAPVSTDGSFHFPALPAGAFTFRFALDHGQIPESLGPLLAMLAYNMPGKEAILQAEEHLEDFRVTVGERASLSMAGVVVDQESKPVQGALIYSDTMPHRATSDSDGHFRLEELPAFPRQLFVEAEGYLPQIIADPEEPISIRLSPAWSLQGDIVTPDGPTAHAVITVTQTLPLGSRQHTITADADGRFTVPAILADEARLLVKVPGYWTVTRSVSREGHETEIHTTIEVRVRDMTP